LLRFEKRLWTADSLTNCWAIPL